MSPELGALIEAVLTQGRKEDTAIICISVKDGDGIYVSRNLPADAKFLSWTLERLSQRLKGQVDDFTLQQPS